MNILKVLSVVDTREYEEIGDRFVPIPGSGNANTCSRCARTHEIHWTVLLESNEQAVMGGSCANAAAIDEKAVRGAEDGACRLARLEKELSHWKSRFAELSAVVVQVEALPRPEFTIETMTLSSGNSFPVIRLGDGDVIWCQFEGITPERKSLAERSWMSKRISERTTIRKPLYEIKDIIAQTERNLMSARRKMAERLSMCR